MSQHYWHEKEHKFTPEKDRPPMPREDEYLLPEMKRYLQSRKLSFKLARENGWYPTSKVDGHDRIVIPCTNSLGIPYWQARAIDSWTHVRYQSPRATRQDSIVLVWPFLEDRDQWKGSIITEGPADALAAAMLGRLGIGLMGNEPPEEVIEFIVNTIKHTYEPALVIPDRDHIEMGAYLTGSLSSRGVISHMRIPYAKDLAGMRIWERHFLIT